MVWGGLGCFGVVWGVSTDRLFKSKIKINLGIKDQHT